MPIRYHFVPNNLKPGTYVARVVQERRVGLDRIIPNIVAKTSLSSADVQGVITALTAELQAILSAGDTAVIDGLATFRVRLNGIFPTPDQPLTRDTAQISIAVREDTHLRRAVLSAVSLERVISETRAPIITTFYDVASEQYDRYTPGSIVRLMGDNLKFDRAAGDEGVFLQHATGETRLMIYSVAGERQIDALIPLTIGGEVRIVVRARYTPNGHLWESRYHQRVTPAAGVETGER